MARSHLEGPQTNNLSKEAKSEGIRDYQTNLQEMIKSPVSMRKSRITLTTEANPLGEGCTGERSMTAVYSIHNQTMKT